MTYRFARKVFDALSSCGTSKLLTAIESCNLFEFINSFGSYKWFISCEFIELRFKKLNDINELSCAIWFS